MESGARSRDADLDVADPVQQPGGCGGGGVHAECVLQSAVQVQEQRGRRQVDGAPGAPLGRNHSSLRPPGQCHI